MHICHRSMVGNNDWVFTDDRPRGVPSPAVLSRALPVVGNPYGASSGPGGQGSRPSSHPRVVVLQVGAYLGADALPVAVGHAREECVVERHLPEVARVVHEALALELLEGVSQHGVAHGAPVCEELLRVGAARPVDGEPPREAVPVEVRVAVEHVSMGAEPVRGSTWSRNESRNGILYVSE